MKAASVHLIAIIIGLVVGFMVRATIQPKDDNVIQSSASPSSLLGERSLRPVDQEVLALAESASNATEKNAVQAALLQMPRNRFPQMAERLVNLDCFNWHPNETLLAAFFSAWGEASPKEALAMIDGLPKLHRPRAKRFVMESWVLTDADAAFAFIKQGKRKEIYELPLINLWNILAAADPHQALAKAEHIAKADERRQQEDRIIGLMSTKDPQFALNWLAQHRSEEEQKEALPNVLGRWAQVSPREAFAHLVSLESSLQDREMFEQVGRSLSQELATEFRQDAPEDYRNAFWGAQVECHATTSPTKAAELAESLPEGWSRLKVLSAIADSWARKDLAAAAKWVSTLPRARSRDRAVSQFAGHLMESDPEAAVTWLADMDHPGDRRTYLTNGLLAWLRNDRPAALTWMDAQPSDQLPEKLKLRVLEEVPES